MTLEEYLAVPYLLVVESIQDEEGGWLRRASYPELSGCIAEGYGIIDVVEEVDEMRVRRIQELVRRGERFSVPRPPLRSEASTLARGAR